MINYDVIDSTFFIHSVIVMVTIHNSCETKMHEVDLVTIHNSSATMTS